MESANLKNAKLILLVFIRVTLLIAIATSIQSKDWETLLLSIIIIMSLTFLPDLFERKYLLNLPRWFHILAILFIYASLFLGEIKNYYYRFLWWNTMLHFVSALFLGIIGFALVFMLLKDKRIRSSPGLISIFAFSFAFSIGGIWEIFEYSMDTLLGTTMQKPWPDTMIDLMVNGLGAFFVSLIGYIYLKSGRIRAFGFMAREFMKKNPKLFR